MDFILTILSSVCEVLGDLRTQEYKIQVHCHSKYFTNERYILEIEQLTCERSRKCSDSLEIFDLNVVSSSALKE